VASDELQDDEPVSVLSIGAVIGGTSPWPRAWRDATRRLGKRVRDLRDGVDAPVNLNVVFHVPGELLQLDWQGVRTGRWSKKHQLLMIQVTVPGGQPPEDIDRVVRVRLLDAIECAEEWAKRKQIAGGFEQLRDIALMA
jgi:hypothetical protein